MKSQLVQYLRNRHDSFRLRQNPNNMMWVTVGDYSYHKTMNSYRATSEEKLIKIIKRKQNKMQHWFTKASSLPAVSTFFFW